MLPLYSTFLAVIAVNVVAILVATMAINSSGTTTRRCVPPTLV
jgi:hypothetical protein